MSASLVLNVTFEPLCFIDVHRALCLVVTDKAEIIEGDESRPFRSQKLTIPYPKVIKLKVFVEIPRMFRKKVSKRVAHARDRFTCQYCKRKKKELEKHERLTIDHVKPRSRGGKTEWENIVTSCNTCNEKKGDKLPYEISMYPIRAPKEPRYIALILVELADDDQRKYFAGWA